MPTELQLNYWLSMKGKIGNGFKKGHKFFGDLTKPNYFHKGDTANEKHHNWKGNKAKYSAIHMWIYNKLGKPETCEFCGKTGLKGRQINWANRDHKYKRNLTDWIRLCKKCHEAFDAGKISI